VPALTCLKLKGFIVAVTTFKHLSAVLVVEEIVLNSNVEEIESEIGS
jgi:hypothetical protein